MFWLWLISLLNLYSLCNSEIHRHSNKNSCFRLENSRAIPPPWPTNSPSPSSPRCYQCCPCRQTDQSSHLHHHHLSHPVFQNGGGLFLLGWLAPNAPVWLVPSLSQSAVWQRNTTFRLPVALTPQQPDRLGAETRVWRRESSRSHTGRLFRKSWNFYCFTIKPANEVR